MGHTREALAQQRPATHGPPVPVVVEETRFPLSARHLRYHTTRRDGPDSFRVVLDVILDHVIVDPVR